MVRAFSLLRFFFSGILFLGGGGVGGYSVVTTFLSNKKLRVKLTRRINDVINVPFIAEDLEAVFIRRGVDACLDALIAKAGGVVEDGAGGEGEGVEVASRSLSFGDLVEDGIDEDDEVAVKESLSTQMNEGIDIAGLNEEQEGALVKGVVDALYSLKGESFAADEL